MAGRKSDRAKGRLRRFLSSHTPADGVLPFVHITRAYSFEDMLDTGCLSPTDCDVFKAPLIYMFYGRPAYRAKDGNNARLGFEWPIVFIFDPKMMPPLKAVYPFDTGAFAGRHYEGFFDKSASLEDFTLEPAVDSARVVVGALYQGHKEYYGGRTRKNVEVPVRDFEAQGLHELARLPGVQNSNGSSRDERSSAIELQFDVEIKLENSLLAVVLPEPYLDDKEVRDCLARWKVPKILKYSTLENASGEAWVGQIYKAVQDFYEAHGWLK